MYANTPSAIARGDDDDTPKQGSLYCGCCCDMRRAVIIVNVILLVSSLITIVRSLNAEDLTAGLNEEQLDVLERSDLAFLITAIATMVFCAVGVVGAATYNIYLVGSNIVVLLAALAVRSYFLFAAVGGVLDLASEDDDFLDLTEEEKSNVLDVSGDLLIANVVISAVFVLFVYVYPHVVFIMEVRNGIMSEETYKRREEASCCCVA